MFPSVPNPSQQPRYSPQPHQQDNDECRDDDEKQQPECDDDGNMPDFDELTKRFEALKRRQ